MVSRQVLPEHASVTLMKVMTRSPASQTETMMLSKMVATSSFFAAHSCVYQLDEGDDQSDDADSDHCEHRLNHELL